MFNQLFTVTCSMLQTLLVDYTVLPGHTRHQHDLYRNRCRRHRHHHRHPQHGRGLVIFDMCVSN